MKTLVKFLFVALCASLLFSCAKDEALLENEGEMTLKKASKAFVIEVVPNGVDDTENLKNAFTDAMAAGDGSVVQLTEGEFFIDLIEVFEFHGTLKGAGKGKTIISTIPDVNVDDVLIQNMNTVLLSFVGGDICVRDLTIHTHPGKQSTGMQGALHGQLGFFPITAHSSAHDEHIKATVNKVEFITQGWVRNGLLAESNFWHVEAETKPLGDIDITVINCSFSGPYWWGYGALIEDIREGIVVVGAKGSGNVFNNCDLGIWHNVSVKASVYGNQFTGINRWFPLQIVNGTWGTQVKLEQIFQSICNIEKNTFHVSGLNDPGGAIIVNDRRRIEYENEIPMLVQVKGNKIHTEENMFTAMGCLNLSGAVIRNNKFSGEAQYGVRLFSQSAELYSDNGLLLGNNFSNSEYSITTVLLGNGTRNWTIVGGNIGELVADYGENNLISGFNNNTSDVPFGQTIVDNLKEMKSPMHDLK